MAGVDVSLSSLAPAPAADARLQAAFRTRLRRASYVPLVIMLLFASALAVAVEQLLSRARWVDHTHAVIAQADRCLLLAVDVETGLRGFQITGDPSFLAPLETARAARAKAWQQLATLVTDNPAQSARAEKLGRQVESYFVFADEVVARRRTGDGVLDPAINGEAKARFDELRAGFRAFGFTEIIHGGLAGPVSAEQATQLAMVLNSARHLLHLINDLLDLARIESGRVEPVREWCDAREIIGEAVGTLRPLAQRKQLPLDAEFSGDTRVFTDRKMLFQIVLNLVNNALKFTEQGRVRITARREGATLRLAVIDTGMGIKEENLPLLFESFRQIEGSARRRIEGTGLGLYLCQRLSGILGGEITVQSRWNAGSTFTVRLPATPAP